mgnify:FL=1
MSDFFATGLDTNQALRDAEAREASQPGFWGNPFKGVGDDIEAGFARGGVGLNRLAIQAGRFAEDFARGVTELDDTPFIEGQQRPRDNWWENFFRSNEEYWAEEMRRNAVDPATRSQAANLVGGLANVLTTFTATTLTAGPLGRLSNVAGAGAAGTGFGRETQTRLESEGVPADQALQGGVIEGGWMTLMGTLPVSIPGRLWQRVASGATINAGLGMGMRRSMEDYLNSIDRPDLAEQYRWLDPQATTVDVLFGAVFGGMFGRRGGAAAVPEFAPDGTPVERAPSAAPVAEAKESPMERDPLTPEEHVALTDLGAAALIEADNIARETAFGIPENPESAQWQRRSIERMEEQIARDEPVDLGPVPEGIGFVPLRPDEYDAVGVENIAAEIEAASATLDGADRVSLVDWVRRQGEVRDARGRVIQRGGIRDDRGDIAGGASDGRQGFASLISPTGRTIDDLVVKAWEDGFFPDHASPETITANDFIQAVDLDAREPGSITADVGGALDVADARSILRSYRERGIDTSLRGQALREAVRLSTFDGQWDAAVLSFADELAAQGFGDVAQRIREMRQARGDASGPDETLFSMGPSRRRGMDSWRGNERFYDDRLNDQVRKGLRAPIGDMLFSLGPRRWQAALRDPETGEIYTGANHGEALNAAPEARHDALLAAEENSGFLSNGKFVSREQALAEMSDALFSLRNPFYSAVERVVASSKTARAPGAQWWATISKAQGVKREELEWIGLADWLKAQEGSISREDVLAFVQQNGVRVEETVLGGDAVDPALQQRLLPLIEERERLERSRDNMSAGPEWDQTRARILALSDEILPLQQQISEQSRANQPKWSQYTLPGGENYREVLLRLPESERPVAPWVAQENPRFPGDFEIERRATEGSAATGETIGGYRSLEEAQAAAAKRNASNVKTTNNPNDFRSSHFDQPNILAHVRFNERTDAQGRRTLFIEEVQSDWHQRGREHGYKGGADIQAIEAKLRDAGIAQSVIDLLKRQDNGVPPDAYVKILDTLTHQELTRLRAETGTQLAPNAPFKNNAWASLAMKRMIRWASENGFDQIAWTRGEHQISRFNLSEAVGEKMDAKKISDDRYLVQMRNVRARDMLARNGLGEAHNADQEIIFMSRQQMREAFGPEISKRIIDDTEDGKRIRLKGDDLRVGGEGMRAFYDRILPNIANDLGKKYGARVGEAQIPLPSNAAETSAYKPSDYRVEERDGGWIVTQDRSRAPHTPVFATKAEAEALRDKYRAQFNPIPETVHSLPITPEMREAAMEGQALFALGDGRGRSSVEAVRAEAVADLGADWSALERASNAVLVENVSDIPRDGFADIPRNVKAVHFRSTGQTYFVAGNIRPGEMRGLILHEIGVHHGMPKMLGKRGFAEVQRQVARMADEGHPAVEEARYWAERYSAHDGQVPEETVAYLIENHADLPLVTRILSRIRQWLIKTFGSSFGMRLTVDDIRALAVTSLRRVAEQARRQSADITPIDSLLFSQGDGPDAGPSDVRPLRDATSAYRTTDTPIPSNEVGQEITPPGGWDSYGGNLMSKHMLRTLGPEGALREVESIFAQPNFQRLRERAGDFGAWEAARRDIHAAHRDFVAQQRRASLSVVGPDGGSVGGVIEPTSITGAELSPSIRTVIDDFFGEGASARALEDESGDGMMELAEIMLARGETAEQQAAVASMEEWARAQRAQPGTMRNVTPARGPNDGSGGEGPLFSFGGRLARTANDDTLRLARLLEREGKDEWFIWHNTGWARGVDKQWRFEIPDEGAAFAVPWNTLRRRKGATPLPEAFDHPALFEAYPQLLSVKVKIVSEEGVGGTWSPEEGVIELSPHGGADTARRTMLHEIQHAIQDIEGFAPGTHWDEVSPQRAKAAREDAVRRIQGYKWLSEKTRTELIAALDARREAYRHASGEAEARAVETRAHFGDLKAMPPAEAAREAVINPAMLWNPRRRNWEVFRGAASEPPRGQNPPNVVRGKRDPIESPEYQDRLRAVQDGLEGQRQGSAGEAEGGAAGGVRGLARNDGAGRSSGGDAGSGQGPARAVREIISVSAIKLSTKQTQSDFGRYRAEIDTPVASEADAILQAGTGADGGPTRMDFDLIDGSNPKETRLPGVHLAFTRVNDGAKGQGVGVWFYRQIIEWADRQRLPVYSDSLSVSREAQRIYAALEKRGYKVERVADTMRDPDDGALISVDGRPVYRVSLRDPIAEPLEGAPLPHGDYRIDGETLRDRQARFDEAKRRQAEYDALPPAEQALRDDPEMMFSMGPARRRMYAREAMENARREQETARRVALGAQAAAKCAARHGVSWATAAAPVTLQSTAYSALGRGLGLAASVPAGIAAAPILANRARWDADPIGQGIMAGRRAGLEAGLDDPSHDPDRVAGEGVSLKDVAAPSGTALDGPPVAPPLSVENPSRNLMTDFHAPPEAFEGRLGFSPPSARDLKLQDAVETDPDPARDLIQLFDQLVNPEPDQ